MLCIDRYQIGLRYTGSARILLDLRLKSGFIPVIIPVVVRGLDVDGEVWLKLGLIPSGPRVGTATWAFVSLPRIKLEMSTFRFFNLMGTCTYLQLIKESCSFFKRF
jgi:Ca2+-dependent lipid-binding protein